MDKVHNLFQSFSIFAQTTLGKLSPAESTLVMLFAIVGGAFLGFFLSSNAVRLVYRIVDSFRDSETDDEGEEP